MLFTRATHYLSPLSEVEFTDVPLTVHLVNLAEETGHITGQFRVYNDTTGELLHTSEIAPLVLAAGESADVSALTPFSPGAPLDDTYFVLFDGQAVNPLVPRACQIHLGAFHFDVKPGPLGEPPAAHAPTHEQSGADPVEVVDLGTTELDPNVRLAPDGTGGLAWQDTVPAHAAQHAFGGGDQLNVQGLSGELEDPQPPKDHASTHEDAGSDELDVSGLSGELADPQPPKAHAAGHHTGGSDLLDHGSIPGLADDDHPQYQLCKTQTLTDAATISWDTALGGRATVTLGGNRALAAATNQVNAYIYTLTIIQDGTGTRTLTYNGTYKFPGGVAPTLTATANAVDILLFYSDGTNMRLIGAIFDSK